MAFKDPPIGLHHTAKATRVRLWSIKRIACGRQEPKLTTAMKIAEAWGWSLQEFADYWLRQHLDPVHWHDD